MDITSPLMHTVVLGGREVQVLLPEEVQTLAVLELQEPLAHLVEVVILELVAIQEILLQP
jgi:hypothetical protein